MATKHLEFSERGSRDEIDFRIGESRDGFTGAFNGASAHRLEENMSRTKFEATSDMAGQPSICERNSHPFDRLVPTNGDNSERSGCARGKQDKDRRYFL